MITRQDIENAKPGKTRLRSAKRDTWYLILSFVAGTSLKLCLQERGFGPAIVVYWDDTWDCLCYHPSGAPVSEFKHPNARVVGPSALDNVVVDRHECGDADD